MIPLGAWVMIERSLCVTVVVLLSLAPGLAAGQGPELVRWQTLVREGAEQLNAGDAAAAVSTFEDALAIAGSFPHADERYLDTVEWLALANWHLGQYAQAEKLYRSELGALTDPASPRQLLPLRQLAKLAVQQQDLASAQAYYQRYVSLSPHLLVDDPELAGCRAALARVYFSQGLPSQAEQLLVQVLEEKQERYGPDSLELVQSLENLAQAQLAQGRKEPAGEHLLRSLAIQEQALGADSPQLVRTLGLLADYLTAEARIDEAEQVSRRVIALEEVAGRPNSDAVAMALENLLELFEARHPVQYRFVLELIDKIFVGHEDWSSFAQLCSRLLELKQQRYGFDDFRLLPELTRLVWIGIAQGDYEHAAGHQQRALDIASTTFGATSPEAVTQLNNLGAVAFAAEEYDEAFTRFSSALELEEGGGPPEDSSSPVVLQNCIMAAERCGRIKEAKQLRRQLRQLGTSHK